MKQLATLLEMCGAAVGCPPREEVPPCCLQALCHPVYTCAALKEKGPQPTGYRASVAPSKALEQLQTLPA